MIGQSVAPQRQRQRGVTTAPDATNRSSPDLPTRTRGRGRLHRAHRPQRRAGAPRAPVSTPASPSRRAGSPRLNLTEAVGLDERVARAPPKRPASRPHRRAWRPTSSGQAVATARRRIAAVSAAARSVATQEIRLSAGRSGAPNTSSAVGGYWNYGADEEHLLIPPSSAARVGADLSASTNRRPAPLEGIARVYPDASTLLLAVRCSARLMTRRPNPGDCHDDEIAPAGDSDCTRGGGGAGAASRRQRGQVLVAGSRRRPRSAVSATPDDVDVP
jgi:hypothetical protein